MGTKNNGNETKSKFSDPQNIMKIPRPVVGMAKEFPSGHRIASHLHIRSQLLYASKGVMTVSTEEGIWVVPPFRAVWIPARTQHRIKASGNLSMRTLYIAPGFSPQAPEHCCVISVSPLLRELILHAVKMPDLYLPDSPEEHIITVILDQIQNMDITPLNLRIPRDSRLKEIFIKLSENPGDNRTLEDWGRLVGATRRTLTRRFQSETGTGFGQWRQQIRILESLKRLALNDPVTTIAVDLGYDSPSAFISMFKKALGKTPGQYFQSDRK